MQYFIKRDENQYGPYGLADLQQYLQSGQIAPTDLCRSEGMSDWVPVTQVVGNVNVPTAAPGGTVYGGAAPVAAWEQLPAPPNMHWAVVLLLSICTCGIFATVWLLILASFIKKIDVESKALIYLLIQVACSWVIPIVISIAGADTNSGMLALSPLASLAGLVFYLVAIFQMKGSLQDFYLNRFGYVHGISGVMTFFFAPYYFQYHINETEKMKTQMTGRVA